MEGNASAIKKHSQGQGNCLAFSSYANTDGHLSNNSVSAKQAISRTLSILQLINEVQPLSSHIMRFNIGDMK